MRVNFNIFVVLIILCIVMVFPFSNKDKFHYQAVLHFTTGVFLFLVVFKPKDKENPLNVNNNRKKPSNEITDTELECLKRKPCEISATQNECETYSRCNWVTNENNEGKCTERTDCTGIDDPYACVQYSHCQWNPNEKQICNFKRTEGKLFNEDSKANRLCFMKNPEYIHDDPKGEYVEDKEYLDCINNTAVNTAVNCKKDAVNRLSCNTVKGQKYSGGICRRDKMYIPPKEQKKTCPKRADHPDHIHPDDKHYVPNTPGYRTPYTFRMNDDKMLRFVFNTFVILFIILLNVSIVKLFKN